MIPAIYLHENKQAAVRKGHPWIFPKAIRLTKGNLQTGELVYIYTHDEELLGLGVYNEHSLYRVRVLAQHWEITPELTLTELITRRLKQALSIRQQLQLPNEQTTAFRWFNSEADGLSGLTIERFNNISVVSSSAYWVEAHKEIIVQSIIAIIGSDEVIWLSQKRPLSQDGWKQLNESPKDLSTEVLEVGVRYQVHFAQSQKTGLFLDQRDNHQRIALLAQGKRVLDLYTYTGGFALHAAKAGAKQVTAVDSSFEAIEQAKRNATLNGLDNVEFIEADARDYLAKAFDYDLIILDPPKLVPSQKHVQQAKNYYRFLHREVFKSMKSGSLLMTCNCSSALSSEDFTSLVSAQALASKKQLRILGVFGPSSCHPTLAAFPEGHYLTAVLAAVV